MALNMDFYANPHKDYNSCVNTLGRIGQRKDLGEIPGRKKLHISLALISFPTWNVLKD